MPGLAVQLRGHVAQLLGVMDVVVQHVLEHREDLGAAVAVVVVPLVGVGVGMDVGLAVLVGVGVLVYVLPVGVP